VLFFYNKHFMFNIVKYREIQGFIEKNKKNCEIVAVSKNHPKESIISAIEQGVYIFGENRVSEAKTKFSELRVKHPKLKLHLTGPLQSNKVKDALKLFDVIHTLDREKIAREFSKNQDLLSDKKIFIQVNIGKEKTKSGIIPDEFNDFLQFCNFEMKLKIAGLMCIPPINEDPSRHFADLKNLAETNNLTELSMGMSNDYLKALDFNASYIRIGTLLFGKRL